MTIGLIDYFMDPTAFKLSMHIMHHCDFERRSSTAGHGATVTAICNVSILWWIVITCGQIAFQPQFHLNCWILKFWVSFVHEFTSIMFHIKLIRPIHFTSFIVVVLQWLIALDHCVSKLRWAEKNNHVAIPAILAVVIMAQSHAIARDPGQRHGLEGQRRWDGSVHCYRITRSGPS